MSQCRNKCNRKCQCRPWYILYKWSSITCLFQHKVSVVNFKTSCLFILFNCTISLGFMFYFCYPVSVGKVLNDRKITFPLWPFFFLIFYLLIHSFPFPVIYLYSKWNWMPLILLGTGIFHHITSVFREFY